MKNGRIYSALLVIAQFSVIALIFSPVAALWPVNSGWQILGLVMFIFSIALAIWALISMQLHSFTVMPEPRESASLTTHGPYRFVRHPMYSAVLLACIGACIMHASPLRVLLIILLSGVLFLKIRREESLLSSQYSQYEDYRRHTKALIPAIV